MTTLKLENDISLERIPTGIKVTQNGVWYIARKWQLTDEVKHIVTTAVEHGFDHLWVQGHPSEKHMFSTEDASHHICFSRDHKKPWEFLIGGEAKPPKVKCITINKACRKPLSELSDDLLWQNFGGKHLFIEPDSLRWVIELLKDVPREILVSGQTDRTLSRRQRQTIGFQKEKHLEDFIFERLVAAGYQVARQQAFATNGGIEPASIPDLIIEEQDRVFIVELKLHAAHTADLHQLARYQNNNQLAARYSGKDIVPVLLTAHFDPSVQTDAQREMPDFELISYDYQSDDRVTFKAEGVHSQFWTLLGR